MRNFILVAVALILSLPAMAQQEGRIQGRVIADSLEESLVHIINTTQRTGTLNTSSGHFQIKVQLNDTLLFTSVQFKKVEIPVTRDILKKGYLEVSLEEEVNLLDQVNISNVDLTGNINTDLGNIKVVKGLGAPAGFSYGEIAHMAFEEDINDAQEAPANLAYQQNQIIVPGGVGASIDILKVAGLVSDLFGGKKKSPKVYSGNPERISTRVRALFDDDFFIYSLEIEKEKIGDFIFYLDDLALNVQLFKEENKMALIEVLIDHSKKYKSSALEN